MAAHIGNLAAAGSGVAFKAFGVADLSRYQFWLNG